MKAARSIERNEPPNMAPLTAAPPVEDSKPLEVDDGPDAVLVLEPEMVPLIPFDGTVATPVLAWEAATDGAAEPVTVLETATSVCSTPSTLWLAVGALVAELPEAPLDVADPEVDPEEEEELEPELEPEPELLLQESPLVMMSMLSHEPVLSEYLYEQAGFLFVMLTLLTYILKGPSLKSVLPPAHSTVPSEELSPPAQLPSYN